MEHNQRLSIKYFEVIVNSKINKPDDNFYMSFKALMAERYLLLFLSPFVVSFTIQKHDFFPH